MTPVPTEHGMLPSPCVGICRLDDTTGWCLGCARDANELASWRALSPAEQACFWADLPRRKTILGLHLRLLPWSGATLLAWLIHLAETPNTGWSIGVYGAVAEFAKREYHGSRDRDWRRWFDPAYIWGAACGSARRPAHECSR